LVDGKHEFTAGELCGLLEAGRLPGGPAATIVVLDADPARPVGVRPAASPAAALAGTLLRPQDALFTTDWFGLGTPSPLEVAARCAVLAAQVPVYEATWPDHDALPALADALADRLHMRLPGRRR
jgi:hypothetical protein